MFVSEKLSTNNFHRLVSYKPEGAASFRSWLNVMIANLFIDWHRHRKGRPRSFKSALKLSSFDQHVFKHRFQHRLSMDACLEVLRGHFPDLNELQLAGAVARIHTSLTPAHMQILNFQQMKTVSLDQRARFLYQSIP